MCDDFFEDNFEDNLFDPDNDFEEDLMDEHVDIEYSEFANDESLIQESGESDESRLIDMAETVIFGSMIVGNAIEESLDEKRRLELLRTEGKQKK
jgi:hypothetical protein